MNADVIQLLCPYGSMKLTATKPEIHDELKDFETKNLFPVLCNFQNVCANSKMKLFLKAQMQVVPLHILHYLQE